MSDLPFSFPLDSITGQFLKTKCQSTIAVDLSETCIKHCKTRFASETHIQFHTNDGTSLAAVPDNSVDFVFSFDSLVDVEKDLMEAYVPERRGTY
jgi:hypothetical protein